jgi:hypothetical protein
MKGRVLATALVIIHINDDIKVTGLAAPFYELDTDTLWW